MTEHSRRAFLAQSSAMAAAVAVFSSAGRSSSDEPSASPNSGPTKTPHTIGLGFSLYGMKSLPVDRALQTCREIGYDCVELPVLADWPLDVRKLAAPQRKELADSLAQHRLRVSALMENLHADVDDARHRDNVERLKRCGELARELVAGSTPNRPPVIETILGGRPAQWEESRDRMAERLADWAKGAEATGTVIAIKPHVGGAMHRPEHAIWLLEQVGSRSLRAAYDFSHYQLRGIDMAESIERLVPHSVFIHVKDARGDADHVQFLLPGEGTIDYRRYLELVARAGYRGDVVVEVSGQIHGRADYDPIDAARRSYAPLAKAFAAANVPRG